MKQTIVPMKSDARLVVRTSADLFIEGSDAPQLVAIVEDGESFRMKDEGGAIYVHAKSDTKLVVPATASLLLERVSGDASILGISGKVEVQRTGGDLHFQKLSGITVDTVGGECVFSSIDGAIEINRVGGDLDGFRAGDVLAYTVGGDVELSAVQGKVQVAAGGNARVQLANAAISETRIRAGGDIVLAVMENSMANLNLESGGRKISVHACGQQLDVREKEYALPLGTGGALVQLSAGKDIEVREGKESMGEFSFIFEDLGDTWKDFGREIEEKIRHSMRDVNHSLRRAGWEASTAMRHAADRMDGFSRDFHNRDGRVYGFGFETDKPAATAKDKPAASDEERVLVLKMLQEKKISVEEAEKLLQALEG